MACPPALIVGGLRSAVVPRGGAFKSLTPHELGAPVVQALLQRAGLPAAAVEAMVVGNALGAGGNPARLIGLATGLPDRCAAMSVDTQCCAGLDAVALGVGLLASGQASVVIAGGVEAWSRAPIRMHRPRGPGDPALPYERPAFAPDPSRDPDLLEAAARDAHASGCDRATQDAHALRSHARALQHRAALRDEIVPLLGVNDDAYPRALDARRAARLPTLPEGLGLLTVSPKADGAAFVLLATPEVCQRWRLQPMAQWEASASVGGDPARPMHAAALAAREAMQRAGVAAATSLAAVELHDAFAVQALGFCTALGLPAGAINRRGGGLSRGHPIGASGAVALVRMLADLQRDAATGARGLAAIAGAGGIGSAAVLSRLG